MSHKGQAKSIAWSLFKIKDNDHSKVICNICSKVISRGGKQEKAFTTSNMLKHLRAQHPKEIDEQEEIAKQTAQKHTLSDFVSVTTSKKNRPNSSLSEASSSDTGGSYSQKTLEETYELKKIWDINSSQAQKIHLLLAK